MRYRNLFFLMIAAVGVGLAFQGCSDDTPDTRVSEEEVQQVLQDRPGIIIDVRTQQEYDDGHLVRADMQYDLLSGEFEAHLDSLDRSKTYYLYCRSGNRSGPAVRLMKEHGFFSVYNIGGYRQLVEAGLESKQ